MNAKHTKGPWSWDGDGEARQCSIYAVDETESNKYGDIAMVNHNGIAPLKVAEANARLIAAAPALLDACIKALPELRETLLEVGHDPSVGINSASLIRAIEAAQEAIEAATTPLTWGIIFETIEKATKK